jgi:hypothetical protein
MTNYVPFTANVRIAPIGVKRFEKIRSMQKISARVQAELIKDTDLNLAMPGGGQHLPNTSTEGFGGYVDGVSAKPAFGDFPSQLTIVGFLESALSVPQPHPLTPVIHTGQYLTGYTGAQGWNTNPEPIVSQHVQTIKQKLETAITNADIDGSWSVYRIEVLGVIFGDRGYHFP